MITQQRPVINTRNFCFIYFWVETTAVQKPKLGFAAVASLLSFFLFQIEFINAGMFPNTGTDETLAITFKETKGKKNRRYNRYIKKDKWKEKSWQAGAKVSSIYRPFSPAGSSSFSFSFLFWETAERSCIGPLIARSSNTFRAILFPTEKE